MSLSVTRTLTLEKAKTFILDISTLDVDALRATWHLARVDEEQIEVLRGGMEKHALTLRKQYGTPVDESGGTKDSVEIAAWTVYLDLIESLSQKMYDMELEVGNISSNCYGRLVDILGFY